MFHSDENTMPIEQLPNGKPVNRWRAAKQVAKGSIAAASGGIQVLQQATHTSTVALAAAGAAASATGIGLVVTGAVITLATAGLSAVSAHKSRLHRNSLQEMYDRRNAYVCGPVDISDRSGVDRVAHKCIAEEVLPYLIEQKNKKYHRKAVGAVPGLSVAVTLRGATNNIYKRLRKTIGKERTYSAQMLAIHLIIHNCSITQAIVSELFSFEEMLWIKDQEYDDVVKLLEGKMKST